MAQNLLLISVDSPVLMGIYEDCKLVKSFSAEGKFSDVLPRLFAEVLDSSAESNAGNSPLGLHSADLVNFGHCADFSLALRPKFTKNHKSQTENPSVVDSALNAQNLGENQTKIAESRLDSANFVNYKISNIFYANGPGNFSAIKLTHIFLQTLSIAKNINLFCADAFHFSNGEFINAYSKVHFYKECGEIRTKTLIAKQQNHFSLPRVLDMSIFSSKCEPLYILPAV